MPPPIVPEDLYRFRWIDHVRLSPDGERVAYQLSWADAESRQNRSRIVVRRLLDQEPVDATAGPRRDHSPEWSPDGKRIVFMSRRGASDQIFVLDVASGGEALQLTSLPEGAAGAAWSPDGKHIAFVGVMVEDPDAVVDDPRPPESREQVRRSPVVRVARRLDYKHDGQGFVDGRYHHLFVVPSDGGEAKQLTSGTWDVGGFDWSPDSGRLVVVGNAEPDADLQREVDLYVVDLEGSRSKLTGGYYIGAPSWSPRGDLIAFVAPNGLDAGLIERMWLVPSSGGAPRCLTLSLDQAVGDSMITDMRSGHGGERIRWSKNGDRLFFLTSGPGVTALYSSDLDGNVWPEVGGPRRIYDFDVAAGVFAFCASEAANPGDLHMVTQGAEARLTDLNPWLRDRYVAQPERHQFTAPDGWVIEGWLLKPENFDPDRLHPFVVEVHGGPHGQYGWAFFHELQVLAGMGYLVLYTNPRGSDGYGEVFRSQVVRDWGGKDFIDLMTAVDQIVQRTGAVDTSRMGIGGGSYGGYMTNWVIGQTDRFAAAVAMRSISNLVSEYAQHDIVLWGALELGPPPWPDLDELWRRSPIRYVQNIKTPLLLTCGEMDLRCVISQSEELFGAMRLLGKTVELVRFPEESHDLSRGGRPDRRVERLRRIGGWFERFLGTAASDRPGEALVADEVLVTAEPATVAGGGQAPYAAVAEPAAASYGTAETNQDPEAIAVSPEAQAVEPVVAAPAPEPEPEAFRPEPEPAPVAQSADLEQTVPEAAAPQEAAAPEWHPIVPPPAEVDEWQAPPAPAAEAGEEWQPTAPPELEPVEEWQPIVSPAADPAAAWRATAPPPAADPAAAWQATVPPPASEPAEAWQPTAPPAVDAAPVFREPEPFIPEPVATAPEPAATAPEPAATAPEPAAISPEAAAVEPAEAAAEPAAAEAARAEAAPAPPAQPAPWGVDPVAQTILAWPRGAPADAPSNGGTQQSTAEEATSIIPAWQPSDVLPESKRTVSLQAVPLEVIESGGGYPAKLTFETGPFAGRIVAIPNQMVTFGRAPDNDIVVGDPATSGRHGRIEVRGGAFWISDLGSTNGTQVNGEPVIEKQLANGDLIAIGQNTIRFSLE